MIGAATMGDTVLVIGSGGREHALAQRLAESKEVRTVVVVPGNAGVRAPLERAEGSPVEIARRVQPDLIVIGPEAPLCEGLTDDLSAAGHLVYGPNRAAARLEGSKAFMKDFAQRHGIRTARFVAVTNEGEVDQALAQFAEPPVIKASGLCAGKGVVVSSSFEVARRAALEMLTGRQFGEAGRIVVIEERVVGREVSVHAICDGRRAFVLPPIEDHKRIGEGDSGPNTGGMGTYGPTPSVDAGLGARIQREMVDVVVERMADEGAPFVGTLFAGLMITPDGEPVLLEINTRFGDPETQVLVNLVDGDWYALLKSAAKGALNEGAVSIADRHALCVVMAASGYPVSPRTGDTITGLADAEAVPGVRVYHAGTRQVGDQTFTAGGRVLGVTAVGAHLREACDRAYDACAKIHFDGAQLRRDIGHRALSIE